MAAKNPTEVSAVRREAMRALEMGSTPSPAHAAVSHEQERRGRTESRPQTPFDRPQLSRSNSPTKGKKRSRSPMKRLLGLGKTSPDKNTPQQSTPKERTPASATKRSLKEWGSMLKHGFLSADQDEQAREAFLEDYDADDTAPAPLSPSRFPISLDPAYQARLQGDLELLVVVSANRFILREVKNGRISRHSVEKVRRYWESRNLAQVVEYQFDQSTQRALILENLQTIHFCGAHFQNSVATSTSLLAWGTLAREMSVRTFCTGDSVIRKWLKDVPGILEMLGAPSTSVRRWRSKRNSS
jgi:hypothetical protein